MKVGRRRMFSYTWKCIKALWTLAPYLLKLRWSGNSTDFTLTLRNRRIRLYLHPYTHAEKVCCPAVRALRVTLINMWAGKVPSAWSGLKNTGASWQYLGGGWGNESIDVAANWLVGKVTLSYE